MAPAASSRRTRFVLNTSLTDVTVGVVTAAKCRENVGAKFEELSRGLEAGLSDPAIEYDVEIYESVGPLTFFLEDQSSG